MQSLTNDCFRGISELYHTTTSCCFGLKSIEKKIDETDVLQVFLYENNVCDVPLAYIGEYKPKGKKTKTKLYSAGEVRSRKLVVGSCSVGFDFGSDVVVYQKLEKSNSNINVNNNVYNNNNSNNQEDGIKRIV
eukprot:Pgem_evm1s5991